MPMYNLIKQSEISLKKSEISCQYYRSELTLNNACAIFNFSVDNNSVSFKFKEKITGQTCDDGTKNVKIMLPLKYLSHFQRIIEMPKINFEINFVLTWYANCFDRSCYQRQIKYQHI